MPRKTISFELDFIIKDIISKFTVKQFDDVTFNITPLMNNVPYTTTNMTGVIYIGCDNDLFQQNADIVVSNNNINIKLNKTMLQNCGRAYAELELKDSNGTVTSSTFLFNIEKKIGEGSTIPGSIEGFVAKYERLISEFKSQVNLTINNCNNKVNSTINNCNANVDNKLNTVDNLINTKISDFEKRFNRLTSSQQQDAEVIDARDGETSLKARLDRDIEKTNKELDKIKKLEESTVSTIETDSDFTTVEATSNGYFEDVKLEGKTLMNLAKTNGLNVNQNFIDGRFSLNFGNAPYVDLYSSEITNISPNSIYTITSNVSTIHGEMGIGILVNNGTNTNEFIWGKKTPYSFTIPQDAKSINLRIRTLNNEAINGTFNNICVSILEGDHTQNQPSYFEGLKSVGDGIDEIVVSSVNENLVLNCSFHEENQFNYAIKISDIKINKLCVNNPFNKEIALVVFNYNTNAWVRDIKVPPNAFINAELNFEECVRFINFPKTVWVGSYDHTSLAKYVIIGTDTLNIDKKRLLYYNNETQTWEKPILREWDSIEKHANGKYYYHQRSGDDVLNGSEDWVKNGVLSTDTYSFMHLQGQQIKPTNSMEDFICDKLIPANYNNASSECISKYSDGTQIVIKVSTSKLSTQDVQGFKKWLQENNVTVVYQLAEEKVYECTNIDLITYANETNYIVECGAISPKTTLKVHNNISNVVSLLQKKVSLLESNITSYMITQNRLMLASRYNADTVSFKVDVATLRNSFEYDNDLYELILNNVLVGKDNYNKEYIENLIRFYWMDFVISDEMYSTLFEIIEEQHDPKIEEETPLI